MLLFDDLKKAKTAFRSKAFGENLDNDQEKFFDFKNGKLTIILSNECNLNCKMCAIKDETDHARLSTQDIFKAVRFGLNNQFRLIEITGGEPFIQKDIFDLLEFSCSDHNHASTIFLTTNGTLLRKSHFDRFLALKNLHFQISLDGIGQYHNEIRGREYAFSSAVHALEELDKRGISFSINSVFQNSNFQNLFELYRYCAKFNYQYHAICLLEHFSNKISSFDSLCIPPEKADDLESVLLSVFRSAKKDKKNIVLSQNLIKHFVSCVRNNYNYVTHPGLACTVPRRSIIINQFGYINPCFHFHWGKTQDRCIKTKPIDEIVFDSTYTDMIRHAVSAKGCMGCYTMCYNWDPDFSRKVISPTLTDQSLLDAQSLLNNSREKKKLNSNLKPYYLFTNYLQHHPTFFRQLKTVRYHMIKWLK